jgi:hypothetical protein
MLPASLCPAPLSALTLRYPLLWPTLRSFTCCVVAFWKTSRFYAQLSGWCIKESAAVATRYITVDRRQLIIGASNRDSVIGDANHNRQWRAS